MNQGDGIRGTEILIRFITFNMNEGEISSMKKGDLLAVEIYAANANLGFMPMRMSCLSWLIPATVTAANE